MFLKESSSGVHVVRSCARSLMILIALLPAPAGAAEPHRTGAPPLYRKLPAAGPAQSMVYGPTDLNGAPLQPSRPALAPPGREPRCEQDPAPDTLQPFRGIQRTTVPQARGLGVLFRDAHGAAVPFLNGEVVLWRAGRYGVCGSLGGSATLVVGTDLVVAFLITPASTPTAAETLEQLNSLILHTRIAAVGAVLNGADAGTELEDALRHMQADGYGTTLARHFADVRQLWARGEPHTSTIRTLGQLTAANPATDR